MLLRARRGGPINLPQNSGPLAHGDVGLNRENSMVFDWAERFSAGEFCVFSCELEQRKSRISLPWVTRSATAADAAGVAGIGAVIDLPKSWNVNFSSVSQS